MRFEFTVYKWGKPTSERVAVEAPTLEDASLQAKKLFVKKGCRIKLSSGVRAPLSPLTVDGAKLTAARIEAQLSMEELAEKIDCGNKSNISRWERGLVHPSEGFMLRLAVVLGRVDFIKEKNGGSDGK